MVDDFWGPSKRILGDPKFVENMSAFDKDTIMPKTAKLVREKYLSNVEANPDKVKSTVPAVDNVTRALFRWVSAIDMYEKVAKNIAPKRDSLARAETDHQVWTPTQFFLLYFLFVNNHVGVDIGLFSILLAT